MAETKVIPIIKRWLKCDVSTIAELNEIKNRVWYEEKEYSILRIYGLFYHSRNKKVA